MSKMERFLVGVLFALALAFCAFIPGMWVGGQTVGGNQGLAGGAIVFMTGVLIAAGAFVLGAILAYALPARALKIATPVLWIPAAVVAALMGYSYFNYRSEMSEYLDQQIANLPPFTLTLSHSESADSAPFTSIVYDTAESDFTATLADASVCTGTLPATSRDKLDLLSALRAVEILLAQQPMACADDGAVLHDVSFEIQEALPPVTMVNVAITDACLAAHEELQALVETVNEVYESNRATRSCS